MNHPLNNSHIRFAWKSMAIACFLLLQTAVQAQQIELLPGSRSFQKEYTYFGNPIVYNNALYLRYADRDRNYVLVRYDGREFTVIDSPRKFDDEGKGYAGDPVVYNGKLYLHYVDNSSFDYLVAYDGRKLTVIDNPKGYDKKDAAGYHGKPVVFQDRLYLHYISDQFQGTLMEFDGEKLAPITTPAEYKGPGTGYFGNPFVHGDKLYALYMRAGGTMDIAYVSDSYLFVIPSPEGYQGNSKGYQSSAAVYQDKIYARYTNEDGRSDLGVIDGHSLRFIQIPEELGGAKGLQNINFAREFNGQLLLQFELEEGNRVLGVLEDTTLLMIPSPEGFEDKRSGFFGKPVINGDLAYLPFHDKVGNVRTLIYDGIGLSTIELPFDGPDIRLGNDEWNYVFNGKVYTWFMENGVSQLAELDGEDLRLIQHPESAGHTNFSGAMIEFQGALYFRYVIDYRQGRLAKLEDVSTPAPAMVNVTESLKVFPNPSPDKQVNIQLANEIEGPVNVQVFDLNGRLVWNREIQKDGNEFNAELNLSEMKNGIYTVRTLQGERYQAMQKLVLVKR